MAYADLLEKEGIASQFLAVITPKRIVNGFTVYSGSVYSVSFDYGYTAAVEINGVELTLGSGPALSAGQYYYDIETETLYVRTSGSDDPDNHATIVFYELYVSTFDAHWYRDPLDVNSQEVYYEPFIVRSPQLKITSGDTLFGYMPIQSSSIDLSNALHYFEKHAYDSSFKNSSIKIYHYLEELAVANIKLIYNGLCDSSSLNDKQFKIKIYNTIDELSKEFRNSDTSFFAVADFPALDLQYVAQPIREVYGRVDGFVPINIDFVDAETATTSDNRVFVVKADQTNLANVTKTVAASPSSTTTRTYLNSAQGLMIGDSVWFDRVAGTDEYHEVTVVDYGGNYIEHAALATPMASGDSVKRGFVAQLRIIQDNVIYRPQYKRDFDVSGALAVDTCGFTLVNNFEATLGMPSPFTKNDRIFCRVYGRTNDVTLGGPSFGTNHAQSGNLANPIVILLDLLKRVGIPESRIASAEFTSALADRDEAIGFAIPDTASGNFPKIKDIITNILKTSLIKFYIDNDLKYSIKVLEPTGANDYEIADDELLSASLDYDFDYSDTISDIIVEYASQEETEALDGAGANVKRVYAESLEARYLHKINKQESFDSLHFIESDAQVLVDRISFILGDRKGTLTFKTKNRFFNTDIKDGIEIQKNKLPGFDFDEDIVRTRTYTVEETQKGLTEITITATDNKGIDDHSVDW